MNIKVIFHVSLWYLNISDESHGARWKILRGAIMRKGKCRSFSLFLLCTISENGFKILLEASVKCRLQIS